MIIIQSWALSISFEYMTGIMLSYFVIGVFDLDGSVKEGLPEKVS